MSLLKVDKEQLARAVDAGVLQAGQDRALFAFLQAQGQTRASFQLSHVAYYFGALLIMGAMGWLLNKAWNQVGDIALLLISVTYMVLFLLTASHLWQRELRIPGGLLAAVAVSLTPLAVFALTRLTGLWPVDTPKGDYHDFYVWVNSSYLLMEVATVVVGLLVLRLLPFPFITLPMAVALWFMSMDLTEFAFGEITWDNRRWVSLWFGLALLLASLLVDGRSKEDFAFWGYLAGLLAFWGGLSLMNSSSELSKAFYCLINIGLMGCAVLLRRPVFMLFGALGVTGYLGHLSYRVFADSLLFPFVLTLLGLGLIALSIVWQKRREQLTQRFREHLPPDLLTFLPALRR